MSIKYFYADSNGNVVENPDCRPKDEIESDLGRGVFRFALDEDANRFYVQDQSFRGGLAAGDDDAWHFLNESLRFVRERFGKNLLDREYGDPKGSTTRRMLSSYDSAWSRIREAVAEEFGELPVDVMVEEYVPDGPDDGDPVALIEEDDKHYIRINRNSGKTSHLGDVMGERLNRVLSDFYLRNVEGICYGCMSSEDAERFRKRSERSKNPDGYDLMFAFKDRYGVRVFKSKRMEDGYPDAGRISDSIGNDEFITFSYSPKNKLVLLHNCTPRAAAKDASLSEVLDGIKRYVSRYSMESDLVFGFDPTLCCPFVSSLRRLPVLWSMIDSPEDITVLQVPVRVKGLAALIDSPKSEEAKAPSLRDYRVKMGIDVEYPFLVMDSRSHRTGKMYRSVIEELGGKTMGALDDEGFCSKLSDPDVRADLERTISYMLEMRMTREDVVDFFAEPGELVKRCEVRCLMKELTSGERSGQTRIASIGPSYDVNSWHHIGLQEDLNRASHDDGQTNVEIGGVEPFNLRRKRDKTPPSYEKRLDKDRDKDLSYMKTVEQLLRESRI